jgi:putative FmdB family regulatory protein
MLHDGPSLALHDHECQEDDVPTYQYQCTECHEGLEVVQKFSDDALTECPACQGRLKKVFSAVGIVFKGSGFYRNDSRSGSKSGAPAASTAKPGDKAGEKPGDKAGDKAAGKKGDSSSSSAASSSASSSSSSAAASAA